MDAMQKALQGRGGEAAVLGMLAADSEVSPGADSRQILTGPVNAGLTRAKSLIGIFDNFRFDGRIAAMAERALVDFRRGVMVSLDDAEGEAAFFTIAQSRALAFFGLAERDVLAVAERAFKHFGFGVEILVDQSKLEAAVFAIDQRRALSVLHIALRKMLSPLASFQTGARSKSSQYGLRINSLRTLVQACVPISCRYPSPSAPRRRGAYSKDLYG